MSRIEKYEIRHGRDASSAPWPRKGIQNKVSNAKTMKRYFYQKPDKAIPPKTTDHLSLRQTNPSPDVKAHPLKIGALMGKVGHDQSCGPDSCHKQEPVTHPGILLFVDECNKVRHPHSVVCFSKKRLKP